MKYIPKEFPADFENVNTNKIESLSEKQVPNFDQYK